MTGTVQVSASGTTTVTTTGGPGTTTAPVTTRPGATPEGTPGSPSGGVAGRRWRRPRRRCPPVAGGVGGGAGLRAARPDGPRDRPGIRGRLAAGGGGGGRRGAALARWLLVTVGNLLRTGLHAGRVGFAVALDARARRGLQRHGRLKLQVRLTLSAPGATSAHRTVAVLLRGA